MCDKHILYHWAVCSVHSLTQFSPQMASGRTNENPPRSTLAGKLSVLHPFFQSRSGGTAQPIWGFLSFPFRSLLRGVSGRLPGVPSRRQWLGEEWGCTLSLAASFQQPEEGLQNGIYPPSLFPGVSIPHVWWETGCMHRPAGP